MRARTPHRRHDDPDVTVGAIVLVCMTLASLGSALLATL